MLKVPKFDFSLLCIAFLLAVRDIAVGLQMPVFVFLLFIFLMPLLLLFRDILNKSLDKKSICALGCITLFYLAIMPMNGTGFKYFLPMIYAGYAFRNVNYKQVSQVFLYTQIFVLVIRLFFIHFGYISEESVSFSYKGEYGALYHDLGYGNPNAAGMFFFFFVASLHIYLYEKHKSISFIFILIISVFAFNYTGSRTSFFASILLMSIYIVPNRIIDWCLNNKLLLLFIPLLIMTPMLFSNWLMDSHEEINDLLSNRVYIASILMDILSSPKSFLTGVVIEDEIPIDNVFCYMLISYGVVSIIVFFLRYMYIIKKRNSIPSIFLASFLVLIISGVGEAAWAAFGGIGASFFWILLFNNTYISSAKKNS